VMLLGLAAHRSCVKHVAAISANCSVEFSIKHGCCSVACSTELHAVRAPLATLRLAIELWHPCALTWKACEAQ
jgi:hypothetical protein